jgi:hypothetical protein
MCGCQAAIVSLPERLSRRISGDRRKKLPLTREPKTFRRPRASYGLPSGIPGGVSMETYQQALTGLSWLSSSRSKTCFDARRRHPAAAAFTGVPAPHAGAR